MIELEKYQANPDTKSTHIIYIFIHVVLHFKLSISTILSMKQRSGIEYETSWEERITQGGGNRIYIFRKTEETIAGELNKGADTECGREEIWEGTFEGLYGTLLLYKHLKIHSHRKVI